MQNISESLRKQREQVMADGSDEVLSRHNSLLEIAVISLYNRLVNRLGQDTEQFRASGAVVALGAFGRGLNSPNETVPILFLKADNHPWQENWLDEITLPIEEAGWVVDAWQGTIDEVVERVRDDFGFFPALLEARYISGNRHLVDQLDKAVDALIEDRQTEYLDCIYRSVKTREERLDLPDAWLEPDLDRNPGGLSDIIAIRAGCRVAANIRNLEDAIFGGYLVRQEVDFLLHAEKTYARLLSLARNITGDSRGIIRFDEQESLADKLGYAQRAGFLAVESFMQVVFQLFHGVSCISQEFWERLHEIRTGQRDMDERDPEAVVLGDGLYAHTGKIFLHTDRYSPTAGHVVRLFRIAAEHGFGFANVTRQWIHHHRNVLDTASGDAVVKEELLGLLRADVAEIPVIRRFYNRGLLTSLIPELSPVHGLVQHDAFHLYPVHEHHLRSLSELKKLIRGDYAHEEPELTHLAQSIDDPVWVFLACLLHDIGKSSGKGHALNGGEMIPTIARRLGLHPEESDKVQFLVAQHLLLMDSASLRDLADEEMLAQCALIVGNPELLDLLVLLTFADMASTGPKAYGKWKDTPVLLLYKSVRHLLEKGEPSPRAIAEKIEQVRARVRHEVADLMNEQELDAYFSQLVPRYLLSMPPRAIARHLRMGRHLQTSRDLFVWEVSRADAMAEITLMSWDRSELLSRAAGILTLHHLNIMGAHVFTMNNGIVLLNFQCRLPGKDHGGVDFDRVRDDMERLFDGKMALDYRIAQHAARCGTMATPVRPTPSRILIDNESSADYTILEVYTVDRVGLLYTISRTLFELQIRIYVAKITTKVDQVADVFYIRTARGQKVTDREQMDELKRALCFWLDGPESWPA